MWRERILELKPEVGVTNYSKCPVCGSNNSITNHGSYVLYNCFSINCSCSGRINTGRSLEDIKNYLSRKKETEEFSLPTRVVRNTFNAEVLEYLIKYNCMEAYEKGLVEIGYDAKLQRVVFYILDEGEVVGAVGRLLPKYKGIKAITYKGSSPCPFRVGVGNTVVVVEDCASACSVSRVDGHVGMALLGTNFKDGYISYLKQYDKVIIALDKDAKNKALDMKKYLTLFHKDVSVLFLDRDLKDLGKEEVCQMFLKV